MELRSPINVSAPCTARQGGRTASGPRRLSHHLRPSPPPGPVKRLPQAALRTALGCHATASASSCAVPPCEPVRPIGPQWLLASAVALLLTAAPAVFSVQPAAASSSGAEQPLAAPLSAPPGSWSLTASTSAPVASPAAAQEGWRFAVGTHLASAPPLADMLGFFDFGEAPPEGDPIEPFNLFGSLRKQYSIENLKGEKVMSRSRGFTVTSCVAGLAVTDEVVEIPGITPAQKAGVADDVVCRKASGTDLPAACAGSCTSSCTDALARYTALVKSRSGFPVGEADRQRVLRSCLRQCSYECGKPGKQYDFVVPSRP